MSFEQYYEIMKTHGISEVFFQHDGAECAVMLSIHGFRLTYAVFTQEGWESFDDLDACVSAPVFAGGRCLRGIWDEIELLAVDGVSPEEYDLEASCNYIQHMKEQGQLLWSCHLGPKRSFGIQLKYMFMGTLPILALSALLPIAGHANWNVLYLSGGCALIAMIIGIVTLLQNPLDINYQITTKKVFLFNGLHRETEFANIRKVKMRRSLFCRDRGTIKLKLKKGISLNYVLEDVPEVAKVYNLLLENQSVWVK